MTVQFTLPTPDKAVGDPNPPGDVNNLIIAATAQGAAYNALNAANGGGADPTGGSDSTTALQDTIGALPADGGTAFIPPGTYIYSTALNIPNGGVLLEGAGASGTEISQTSSSQHGITSSVTTGLYDLAVRKMTVNGPGASETDFHGVYFDAASGNIESLVIEYARIQYFGDDGIHLTGPINSSIRNCIVQHTGNNGISVVDGTSTNCDSVYVRSQAGIGYSYNGTAYFSLSNCACDFGEIAYEFTGVNGATASGCGGEAQTTGTWKITGASVGVVLEGCYSLSNPGIACWVTGDSTATIIGFREITPAGGATASIQVDAGSSATVIDPVLVTAPVYNGNVTVIENGVATYWSGGSIVPYPYLCAPKQYAPASQTSLTVNSATLAAFASGTVATNSFTAPATGAVMVDVTAVMDISSATASTVLAIAETGSVTPVLGGGVATFQCFVGGTSFPVSTRFYVNTLTAGSAYTFDLLGAVSAGDTATIFAYGGTALTIGSRGAPVIMTVQPA
jgi:hypothetical protein